MNAMLKKEFTLSFFPLPYCFLLLSSLLLIPNYPYFITFFYTALGIMFLFQYNREQRDLDYMMTLPVTKEQMVSARFVQVVTIELLQAAVCIPFMLIRSLYAHLNNAIGFEANAALLGLGLVMLGLFNRIFLPGFYKNGRSIGLPFVKGCIMMALYMTAAEISLRIVPYFARYCDSMAGQDVLMQIPLLAMGLLLYSLLTRDAKRVCVRRFTLLDL